MGAGEYLKRALMPRAVVALSEMRGLQKLQGRMRRTVGGRGCAELYFAFDDPYSAIALPALLEMSAQRNVELQLYPLVDRGIPGDPAAAQRRQHAITDCAWIARRSGKSLMRTAPIDADSVAFLAAWTESLRESQVMARFAVAALTQLWFKSSGDVEKGGYQAIFRKLLQSDPPSGESVSLTKLNRNARRLYRLGHWESPAARVEGEWFFAHERMDQIEKHLDALGW